MKVQKFCMLLILALVDTADFVPFSPNSQPSCTLDNDIQCSNSEIPCSNMSQVVWRENETDRVPHAPVEFTSAPFLGTEHEASSSKVTPYVSKMRISWKPSSQGIEYLRGYFLHILDMNHRTERCFLYQLNETLPEYVARKHTTFAFESPGFFNFGKNYHFRVHAIPAGVADHSKENFAEYAVLVPSDPNDNRNMTCNETSSPNAVGWASSFTEARQILVKNSLFVEFLAAPPKYCIEQYDMRLYNHIFRNSVFESVKVNLSQLYPRQFKNYTFMVGNHTFEDVPPGDYELGIMPVDRTTKSKRCLCITQEGTCQCQEFSVFLEIVGSPAPVSVEPCTGDQCLPASVTGPAESSTAPLNNIFIAVTLMSIFALIVVALFVVLRRMYAKYGRPGLSMYTISRNKMEEMRLFKQSESLDMSGNKQPTRLLIIYAKDSFHHEQVVRQLANFLSAQNPDLIVDVDFNSQAEIALNKTNWACSSLHNDEKILLVNSAGAYARQQAKLDRKCPVAPNSDPFNDMFEIQLDLLTQMRLGATGSDDACIARRMATVTFDYTPARLALLHLAPQAGRRFRMPQHSDQLVDFVCNGGASNDLTSCSEYAKLCEAIAEYSALLHNQERTSGDETTLQPDAGFVVPQIDQCSVAKARAEDDVLGECEPATQALTTKVDAHVTVGDERRRDSAESRQSSDSGVCCPTATATTCTSLSSPSGDHSASLPSSDVLFTPHLERQPPLLGV